VEILHMGQRGMCSEGFGRGPDLEKNEQVWILRVTQHVVFDAARFGTAVLDIGEEQRFECLGFVWLRMGVQDKSVGFWHDVAPYWLEQRYRNNTRLINDFSTLVICLTTGVSLCVGWLGYRHS